MMKDEINKIKPLEKLNIEFIQTSEQNALVKISFDGNQNDKNTMFAGSIYSSMVFCGWCLAKYISDNEPLKYDVMIKESKTLYFSPIKNDAIATANLISKQRKKNGNIAMIINVYLSDYEQNKCAELSGEYIAKKCLSV